MANTPARIEPRAVAFRFRDVAVTYNADRMVNLTEMWEAAGRPDSKAPFNWRRLPQTIELLAETARKYDLTKSQVIRSERGRGAATWGHWQVSIAYAKYLSPEFALFVGEAFREWSEEKADPGLKIERGIRGYRRRGYDDPWIQDRIEGIAQRVALTATMQDHNCRRVGSENPYQEGTTAIYLPVLGKTAREIKAEKGLPKSARTRDYMDRHQLAAVRFAESMAEKLIKDRAADGNAACVDCCRKAGSAVKLALTAIAQGA